MRLAAFFRIGLWHVSQLSDLTGQGVNDAQMVMQDVLSAKLGSRLTRPVMENSWESGWKSQPCGIRNTKTSTRAGVDWDGPGRDCPVNAQP